MSAERELERASQEFWLARVPILSRCEQLAGSHTDDPIVCGYAYLVARAEERYTVAAGTTVGPDGVTVEDGEGKWVIVRCGETWFVNSERQVWSKDSRDWGTVHDDGTYRTFGQAYRAMDWQRYTGGDL